MIKKLSCVILIICICVSSVAYAKQFDDVKKSDVQDAIGLISALGIMGGYEDQTFRPENTLTRAELVKIVAGLYNIGDAVEDSASSDFYDVASDHWAKKYINFANKLKLVKGDGNGNFFPDNSVSIQDAAAVFVNVLGYSFKADEMGGYPVGNNIVASQLKLFEGIAYKDVTENLNRANAALMLYNVLNANYIELTYATDNSVSYDSNDDVTLLNKRFNVYKQNGIVTGTPITTFTEKSPLKSNEVEIDNVVYYTKDVNVNKFIGRTVAAYYEMNNDEKYIIAISGNNKKDEIISLNSDIIEDVSGIYTAAGKIVYWEDSVTTKTATTLHINPAVKVIYNGKTVQLQDINNVDLKIKSGIIDCINWGDDDLIDVLVVRSYENFVVDQVVAKADKNRITDVYRKALEYDPSDKHTFVSIFKDGMPVGFDTIISGNIITATVSLDKQIMELNISDKLIEGEITEIGTEGLKNDKYIIINKEKYFVADNYIIGSAHDLSIGDTGKFYLDMFGKMSYYSVSADSSTIYAYLVTAKKMGGFKKTEVKLLMPNNAFQVFELEDKIKFSNDGISLNTITSGQFVDAVARSPVYYDSRDTETQVITYQLNSLGLINEIRFANSTPAFDEFSAAAPEYSRYYSSSLFDQKWKVTPSTTVFNIPCTNAGEEPTRYSAGKANQYFKDGANYQVLLYDVSKNGEIGAIMYRTVRDPQFITFTINKANSPVMVVDKIVTVLGKNNEQRSKLTGISAGEYVSVLLSSNITSNVQQMSKLVLGNVIQYQTNKTELAYAENATKEEEIAVFNVLVDNNNRVYKQSWNYTDVYSMESDITTSLGLVSAFDGYRITISMADNRKDKEVPFYTSTKQKVVSVNLKNKTLSIITPSEISNGQVMFVRQRYNRIRDVVVYD